MRTGRLRTLWLFVVLAMYTAIACLRSIFKYLFSIPTRAWVDKIIHQWADRLLKKAQVTYEVINPLNIQPQPGKATLLMCNHSSLFDIPLAFKAFPQHSIRMLAKHELSKIPIMGKGMTVAEFPFINRKNRFQAIKDLHYAKELMESGILLWVAPEGTRSVDGTLGAFKKGAFITAIQAKAIIIPIGIRGADAIVPAKKLALNLKQKAEIHIGAPIDATQFTLNDKNRLLSQTYEAIKQLIN